MSVVIVGHFYGLDGPTKFRWPLSKIKGTYNSKVGMAQNGQKPDWAPGNDPKLTPYLAKKQWEQDA